MRDINEGYPDHKQSNFTIELNNFDKGIKTFEKKVVFFKSFFSAKEKVANNFKSILFQRKIYIQFQHVNQHQKYRANKS